MPGWGGAWRDGLRAGCRRGACCANLLAIALAAGIMDLRVMAAVAAAMTAERLAPRGADRRGRGRAGVKARANGHAGIENETGSKTTRTAMRTIRGPKRRKTAKPLFVL
ncbi:DUF2182 domain-containing protein [Burkholderia sp. F1]|uniref:copper chaperone n=1 Tax=Burkholderia sp. F1 TaxID=3366817 RepID=UPI003D739769